MDSGAFVGTWRLLTFDVRDDAGNVHPVLGDAGAGYLAYTADGHVLVTIQARRPPAFADGDLLGGTDAEVRAAYAAYTSYAGTYVVRGAQVVHRVELSLFPNWIGGEQERTYEFVDDRLVLTAAPTRIRGAAVRASLVWERVASA
jgi:hypothetical protein